MKMKITKKATVVVSADQQLSLCYWQGRTKCETFTQQSLQDMELIIKSESDIEEAIDSLRGKRCRRCKEMDEEFSFTEQE